MKASKRLGLAAMLVTVGIGVSLYLLFRTYGLLYGDAAAGGDFCSTVIGVSCDSTLTSETSWLLGIPVAGWGLVYFGGLFSLLLMAWLMEETFYKEAIAGAVTANLAGLGFSVYLIFLIASGRAPLCPLCLVVHTANVLLLPTLLLASGEAPGEVFRRIRNGFTSIFETGGSQDDSQRARNSVAFLASALVALALYQWVFIQTQARATSAGNIEALGNTLEAIRNKKRVAIEIRPDDPRLGYPDAAIQMIVFSDLECPSCRDLHPYYEKLMEKFAGEITIIFKHFPLNSECNRLVSETKHPGACRAAFAAEAARRQGMFWEAHDSIFELGEMPDDSEIASWADGIALDSARLIEDMSRDDVKKRIQEDVELGINFEVRGTPTIFLNGRRIKDFERIEDEVRAESFWMTHLLDQE